MIWFWNRKSKATKITERTNAMLASLPDELDKMRRVWALVDYGPYVHKPTLARVVHYVTNMASDDEAISMLLQNRILLNDEPISNPHLRLDAGEHILYLKGVGFFRFVIE